MKNKNVIKISFGFLVATSLTAGILLGVSKNNQKEVSGYSVSELPTTIDLNDTSVANIRNYYSSLNNLSTSERQGNNLLKNLKNILKNGQKYYSYDVNNGLPIWQMYEITDRDWSMSPASSTTYGSYNASTNIITNYEYGNNSNSKNDPYVHSLYTNRNIANEAKAWGDHSQTNWGINREHVWPKAEGFETEAAGGARGDPMHLMAGNGYANNIHSNYFYGYVDTSSTYTDCGSKYSYTSGNLLGKSKTVGGSKNVFEPQDSDKGDIARAIFYMVARYNYLSGSDSDGIDSDNPNLSLTQNLSDWSQSSFDSTTTTKGYMGIMTDLLAWHHADPVDQYEIHRNNLLYTNFTNNRNPFIDFPEWVDFIWGTASYNGTEYQSYSSTPTGYATPSTDTINGYNSGSVTPSTLTTSGSVDAADGALEGWTSVGTGTPYTNGEVKFDSTGDNVYCLTLFSGNVSYNMTKLSVTLNAKLNVGTGYSPSEQNSFKVEALDSSGNVLNSETKTGASVFSTEQYEDVTFTISGNLTNCSGIRITYINKKSGNLGVSSVSWTATYLDESVPEVTSISASVNKTYGVGEIVSLSDINVVDNNNTAVSGFAFANSGYQVTYADAPSGGTIGTKTFNNAVTYNGLSCSLTINVQRQPHISSGSTVSYTGQDFSSAGISSTYTENQTATIGETTFKVSGYIYNNKLSLSSSRTSAPGSVVNATPYSCGITNVVVNGAIPDVQLSVNGSNWVDLSSATTDSVDYFYFKVYFENTAQSSYVNITYIDVTTKNETPENVANYIMFEDTENQCNSKFANAKVYFERMTSSGRTTFMTSNDYVIEKARERLQAWATYLGKEITYVNGDYVVSDSRRTTQLIGEKNNTALILVLATAFSVSSAVTCILIKRKKQVR